MAAFKSGALNCMTRIFSVPFSQECSFISKSLCLTGKNSERKGKQALEPIGIQNMIWDEETEISTIQSRNMPDEPIHLKPHSPSSHAFLYLNRFFFKIDIFFYVPHFLQNHLHEK